MIYKGNKKYIDFINYLKEAHFYGNNKRILKLLTDNDLNELDNKTFSYYQKKLAQEHDFLILALIDLLLDSDLKSLLPDSKIINYIKANSIVDEKLLQIAKIRMVIKPEFLINTTIHSVTNHKYAVLRTLWLDKDFRKIKKFSISLGNIETLELGNVIQSNKANKNPDFPELYEAKENLTKKLYNLYEEEYS